MTYSNINQKIIGKQYKNSISQHINLIAYSFAVSRNAFSVQVSALNRAKKDFVDNGV